MSHSAWTEEGDKRLRELARAGHSLTEIGRELGLAVTNVRLRTIKLGIPVARDRMSTRKRKRP